MSSSGTGNHGASNAATFLQYTAAINLPTLTTSDGSKSPHLPTGQRTRAPEVNGYTDLAPMRQGVDLGQDDYFQPNPNDTDIFTRCILALKLDGLTATGGGQNARYPDDVMLALIDSIDYVYGRKIQTVDADELHFRRIQETPEKELGRLSKLQGLGLSVEQRVKKAAAACWYYLEIPFFWAADDPRSDLHQYAFTRPTQIIIHWRRPEYCLQQDLTDSKPTPLAGGTYILDHFIRFGVAAPTAATKKVYMDLVATQGDAGFLYLCGGTQKLRQQVNAAATSSVVQLNTFTGYGYNLRFVMRPVVNLNASYLNNRRFETCDIQSCKLKFGGKEFFPDMDDFFMKYEINNRLFDGNPELAIYNIPQGTEHPDMHTDAMGGFDYQGLVTPEITLTTVALDQNYYVDFWLYCHNYIRMILTNGGSAMEPVLNL